jgi:hypothetical protein
MDENQTKQNNLLDTTDCLEAVGVFRGWKNFFFVIALLCLIVLQASFWLVDRGCIAPCGKAKYDPCKVERPACPGQQERIKEAAEKVVAEPNKSAEEPGPAAQSFPGKKKTCLPFSITFGQLYWAIHIVNGLLILTAVLYCLCMLFCLKVSLIGRLGGINHISRAFFLSLIMVVLLLPWQRVFGYVVTGAIYTPCDLMKCLACETANIFCVILYYLRFSGYGLLVLLLLIFSQVRSSRWAKAVLRRLEVI